ncbi:MAG: UbiD family decarboxylase [Desulfobacteraceae bacterium]|nr:UbiD family decarboxylase [Desulfobacteraceae bacterium]
MFTDLRSFLEELEKRKQLVRIKAEVDPDQEIAVIQQRVISAGGPALLFERVKGSAYGVAANLFGARERVAMVCGHTPSELGERVARVAHNVMPPSLKRLWKLRKDLFGLFPARMRTVKKGPVLETQDQPPDLTRLPVITCWPEDGGPFFTLPLVHTVDPVTGQGNLGMYRLQRFDQASTGMHWQIERGGGFHFHKAVQLGRPLKVSVFLGGPPSLIIAAIAPLPEGLDERLLAAYMMGRPLNVIERRQSGHRIPASSEFVLEGEVSAGDTRLEGPFGDHFGHYSEAADYPVFRVRRVLARRNAIFPVTVVGKPVQEDYYIGEALQEITLPLLKLIKPSICDLWAYPETGFHPLAVMAVRQRYEHEDLKMTLAALGEGHLCMTKVMITVDENTAIRDIEAVSKAVWRYLKPENLHILAPTAQDTLDFTGPAMNTGSRLILLATKKGQPVRSEPGPVAPHASELPEIVVNAAACGPAFLMLQVSDKLNDLGKIIHALQKHPRIKNFLFVVLVSQDVPLDDPVMRLWGWFTRFDPDKDIYPAGKRIQGNRLVFDFPLVIDARWKKGYPDPLEFDPEVAYRVDKNWASYGLP